MGRADHGGGSEYDAPVSQRALLVEDDARLSTLLVEYLGGHGVDVDVAVDGRTGLAKLAAATYDVVLLDLGLPDGDGLDVCRRIRGQSRVPLLMITARGDEADRIVGLELGADDYLSKPFSPRELLARIRAVLRRAAPEAIAETIRVGALVLEVEARRVRLGDREVELTGLEFDLLLALARRAGRVIPRDSMMELAGRTEAVGERTVDVHVAKLRAKLGDDAKAPRLLRTVRGVGYQLVKEGA